MYVKKRQGETTDQLFKRFNQAYYDNGIKLEIQLAGMTPKVREKFKQELKRRNGMRKGVNS